jgi:hypothetical protein
MPINTTDLRPTVTCRPTINFSLPSALGDQVHNLETFGLKAVVNDHQPAPFPTYSSSQASEQGQGQGRFWKSTQPTLPVFGHSYSREETNPVYTRDVNNSVRVENGSSGTGRYDLSPVIPHGDGNGNGMANGNVDVKGNGNYSSSNSNSNTHSLGLGAASYRNGNDVSYGSYNQPSSSSYTNTNQDPTSRFLVNSINPNRIISAHSHGLGQGSTSIHGTFTPSPYSQGQPKRIHPRPLRLPSSSSSFQHSQSHQLPLNLHLSQPPPHTYHYPSTPITTTTTSSSSNSNPNPLFYASSEGQNPILPGVNQLFNYTPPPPIQMSAPPSTIFPNAVHRLAQTQSGQHHPQSSSAPHGQIFHPPPIHTARSVSTSHHSYDMEMDMGMEVDLDMDSERQELRVSESPSIISIDQEPEDRISRSDSVATSFESEEGVDDDEVLSEYKPNKPKSNSKGKGGKGKGNRNRNGKQSRIEQEAAVEKLNSVVIGPGMGMGMGKARVPQTKFVAMVNSGYQFVWEDGVAYTDDAELKQTREVCLLSLFFYLSSLSSVWVYILLLSQIDQISTVEETDNQVRRRCHNCSTRTPPSWRKSNLVPGKIVRSPHCLFLTLC